MIIFNIDLAALFLKFVRILDSIMSYVLIFLILSIILTIIFPDGNLHGAEKAKITATKMQLSIFAAALESYHKGLGRYPTTAEGLNILMEIPDSHPHGWDGPYMETHTIPRDPWGQPYIYRCPGIHNPQSFDVFSMGPDQVRDTPDDIANFPLPSSTKAKGTKS